MGKYIIALDQGTTSSRAVLFDREGALLAIEQKEFTQHFPKPGWVEHDADEIWSSQQDVLLALIENNHVQANEIIALGITNQRETAIVWDKETGKPVYNAIVWQDKRTSGICNHLKKAGYEKHVRDTTGLVIDAYFSGTKVKWILDEIDPGREKAKSGTLAFGTVDTWLVYKLTQGKEHLTDLTNASRTMLFDINKLGWDTEMLDVLDIPAELLPSVKPSVSHFGDWEFEGVSIPIHGIAGDQQAALFGQTCFEKGTAKNTYGTGCFMLMNTGETPQLSENGLLSTIAFGLEDKVYYALEGSIFVAGAAVQWLRDGLEIIQDAAETEQMAKEVQNSDDVVVVPAFAGLGAPYWDMYARGAIFGLTRDTDRRHLAKATLDSLAYQTRDILQAMEKDAGIELQSLKVDGGAVANDYLMQFQADILGVPVLRPGIIESTAQGAAYLAGIGAGIWKMKDLTEVQQIDRTFEPGLSQADREKLYTRWKKAVQRTMNWLEN
ncbi:MAG: glycerol kinase GlpK [Cytophagales bacterium]|nr:glycerol kinase GlpK [Cytophagales bacterium]